LIEQDSADFYIEFGETRLNKCSRRWRLADVAGIDRIECYTVSKISQKYVNLHGLSERKSAGARDRLEIVESDARLLLKRRPN
jgi:hypothetical protein